jgi:hypothetical protein
MCCGWRVEYPPRRRARRVGHMRTTITEDGWGARPPDRAEMTRTAVSAAAYDAIATSSMRLLLMGAQRSAHGCFLWLDQVTVNKLMAAKRLSEDFSDVMIRMARRRPRPRAVCGSNETT